MTAEGVAVHFLEREPELLSSTLYTLRTSSLRTLIVLATVVQLTILRVCHEIQQPASRQLELVSSKMACF